MNQLINLKTICTSLIFALVNSIMILGVGKLAVGYWGRPRGVAYGIWGIINGFF